MQLDQIDRKAGLARREILERPLVYVLQVGGEQAIQCPADPCEMSLLSPCDSSTRGRVILRLRPYR